MRVHLLVYGAVQGVGYRWFVAHHARSLGLAGYVLNRPDGTVELEAAGPADALVALRHTVGNGPPGGRVDRVEDLATSDTSLETPFAIRRGP